ncbi:sigma-70 family RNA polymerase sigma factor [Candidatus Woesearchaeota archaeon]|nr:sigma-70 family RNA polymerase sigma factor [Candidatus Woesearchaeota archaeon]
MTDDKDLDLERSYYSKIKEIPTFSDKEELECALAMIQGCEDSKQKLIEHNLRLVYKEAGKFVRSGFSRMRLVSEGNDKLMRVVAKYDPEKSKFSTFITKVIRRHLFSYVLREKGSLRTSNSFNLKKRKFMKRKYQLQQELGREPTDEEVLEGLDLSKKFVERMNYSLTQSNSLDDVIKEDGRRYHEVIPSKSDFLNNLNDESRIGLIEKLFEYKEIWGGNDREIEMVKHFFGYEKEKLTLEQLKDKYNVTVARVGQLKDKAIKKLKKTIESYEEDRHYDRELLLQMLNGKKTFEDLYLSFSDTLTIISEGFYCSASSLRRQFAINSKDNPELKKYVRRISNKCYVAIKNIPILEELLGLHDY